MSTYGETGTATKFSIRRDIKHVQWKPTFQVIFVRAVGVSIVFNIILGIMLLLDSGFATLPSIFVALPVAFFGILFSAAFIYPVLGVISWYLTSLYTKFALFGFFGIFYLAFTLPLVFADPLVFFIHKSKPEWVPVDEYHFINFAPVIFVLNPDHMNSLSNKAIVT